jgi:hypothetical protein
MEQGAWRRRKQKNGGECRLKKEGERGQKRESRSIFTPNKVYLTKDKRTEKGAGDKRIGLQTKEGGRRETKDRRLEKVDANRLKEREGGRRQEKGDAD